MKSIAVMGSTGSIGCRTLDIVSKFSSEFKVKALAARTNIDGLAAQILSHRPEMVAVYDHSTALRLKERLPSGVNPLVMWGKEGYRTAATWDGTDTVVMAMVGAAGLEPTLDAINAGKEIALATKETLVMAGLIVKKAVEAHNIRLMPIDSEHSAIFQCLNGQRRQDLDKIILTASGGPFLRSSLSDFKKFKAEHALRHPNWDMGPKITIDCATMMNKGLEVIEAKWLFDLSSEQIQVMIHPQSIVHSMVAFHDGSVIAQLGIPDMQAAIAYALSFPQRLPLNQSLPDLVKIGALTFEAPDLKRFPCIELAFEAIRCGGSMPAVLNAANEVAVESFLSGKLAFPGIYEVIHDTMNEHNPVKSPDLAGILSADEWARHVANKKIANKKHE